MSETRFTPGPWRVAFSESTHRKGSPACKGLCDAGAVPVRIEHDCEEEAARNGCPGNTELHVFITSHVNDIVAVDDTHVVCFGHDYGDYGSIRSRYEVGGVHDEARWEAEQVANAHLIAASPGLYRELETLLSYFRMCVKHLPTTSEALDAAAASADAALTRARGEA